jgi:hypothetical protein
MTEKRGAKKVERPHALSADEVARRLVRAHLALASKLPANIPPEFRR